MWIILLQTSVSPQMRGRVISLNTLFIMGIHPRGDFPIGALMQGIGGTLTILFYTGLVSVYILYPGLFQLFNSQGSVQAGQ